MAYSIEFFAAALLIAPKVVEVIVMVKCQKQYSWLENPGPNHCLSLFKLDRNVPKADQL